MSLARKPKNTRQRQAVVKIRPLSETAPLWLQWFMLCQRYSFAIAFVLIAATFSVYASIVYSQKVWSREYQTLQKLQRQERQLTAARELLKTQLAEQAEQQNTGLVQPTSENNLFLEAAPQRPANKNTDSPVKSTPNPKLSPTPLGY